MADKNRFASETLVENTKFDNVNFSDFMDISGKSTEITSVSGTIKKMRGTSLYLVLLMINIASGSRAAGSSGFYIGRFLKNISPRVVIPLVCDDVSGEARGSLYSNGSTSVSRIYGNTGTGVHYAYFICYATDPT